uniref:NADH-ubiquinone oxidoreductase chain 5 n=1 Tax=Monomorium pharaonis TaxID=307658 RepID=A0A7L8EYR7_MONPH|nr:NADH dehydrogenase subunit 5 [Monomorium pharaonis]QOE17525.1 NADH dehydrogenase subunit 5 [Monomorium pharaonis]
MIKIYMYFLFLIIVSMMVFMGSLILFYLDMGLMLEWLVFSMNSLKMEMVIILDWISLLFISFVFMISSFIILYMVIYMMEEKFMSRFTYLVMMFIFSMVLMILSPNVISILLGWDGLGLVSYCLVIYYQNWMSYNSGMVTVLCNRMGDVGILMLISLMSMMGSWSIWSLVNSKLLVFMLLLAAITKSAQMPFSSWLPMAMAAPTPVSALVHSSTLVTAGVYLMIRFNRVLMESGICSLLLFLSVFTMFMAGVMASVENDLKKIIALSTLSQLGLMMMILSFGLGMVSYYHLLVHAVFKSMLFMCAGIIIHSMMNNQDIRLFGNLNEIIPFTMMSFYISNLALCGFPFISGFYSKDLIMELVYDLKVNIFLLIFILISLMLTVIYSFRLYYYMFFSEVKFYSYNNLSENFIMNSSMMVLVNFSICIGSLLNWMFFYDYYLVYLSLGLKLLVILLCMLSIMLSLVVIGSGGVLLSYYGGEFLGSMWFMNIMYLWIYNPINKISGMIFVSDKVWLELVSKNMILFLIKHFKIMFYYNTYMFMFIFICLYLFMVIIY